ncbi:aminodeoxychorismate synthase component I [Mycobacterium sp. MYCO198283]|uniref:aminodeoxychorismate synthase component I n=1 Tax=Mycobacterium sp. MYCO198283 TaxID=2883505 RepID=UPI001E2DDA9C|nr:aminodeoxychorismate synthase component I [Mycobacterium sp. MYCO198283]MCG5430951.1 aminodeoxychorismate synthase component I [Mycobacterium sp. MYCO198283]
MRCDRLGVLGEPPAVLRSVVAATERLGVPPPAALIGDWFGGRAVLAPSVDIRPVPADAVFDVPTGAGGPHVGGGWLGYLSYPDAGAGGAPPRIPVAAGGWTPCVLRQDRDGCWWYEDLAGDPMPPWLAAALAGDAPPRPWTIDWTPPDRASHRAGVSACLAAIRAGEVYQACVCTAYVGTCRGRAVDVFADTVGRISPARAAFLAGDWGAVASFSPELFLARAGPVVTSSPIKGTLPASAAPAALRESVKDVAENVMIVDLVRNDLSRVATVGGVTVTELLALRPAPGVWHLVSTVRAAVPPEVSATQLLAATFPPASVTGTPKHRARQLLRQWEPARRGVYCGTIGLASPIAGTELNVAIRTIEFDTGASAATGGEPVGRVVLGVGGGITADSDPDREWDECLHKAAAIVGVRTGAPAPRRRTVPGAAAPPDSGPSPAGRHP